MKVRVIKTYNDRLMGKIQEPGDVLSVDEARAKVLIRRGFAQKVKEPKKEEPKE